MKNAFLYILSGVLLGISVLILFFLVSINSKLGMAWEIKDKLNTIGTLESKLDTIITGNREINRRLDEPFTITNP